MGKYKVSIDKIVCLESADPNGHDEVWLLAQGDAGTPNRYPQAATATYSMNSSGESTWMIDGDFTFEFDRSAILTLYEQDLKLDISTTDLLGNARFTSGAGASGTKSCTNGDDSSYQVYFTMTG